MLNMKAKNMSPVGASTARAYCPLLTYFIRSIPHPSRHRYTSTPWNKDGRKIRTAGIRPTAAAFLKEVFSEYMQYTDGRHNASGTALCVITTTSTHIKRKTPVRTHRVFGPLLIRGILLVVHGKRYQCHYPCPFDLER